MGDVVLVVNDTTCFDDVALNDWLHTFGSDAQCNEVEDLWTKILNNSFMMDSQKAAYRLAENMQCKLIYKMYIEWKENNT